jgi:hypothetical protein
MPIVRIDLIEGRIRRVVLQNRIAARVGHNTDQWVIAVT